MTGLKLSLKASSYIYLFAVNEFNGLFLKTTFKDAKQKWVKGIYL